MISEERKIRISEYKKNWYDKNKERLKKQKREYYLANKDKWIVKDREKLKKYRKEWYLKNKDRIRKVHNETCRRHYKRNKEKCRKASEDWKNKNPERYKLLAKKWKDKDRKLNPEKYRLYQKNLRDKTNWENLRYKNDIEFRLRIILRKRFYMALKRGYKITSAVRMLGCSIEEFKNYLESLFQPGMTWENQGKNGWHIDHIRPLSSFNLQDPLQVAAACHYKNLQPLWARDNIIKGNKLTV